jgi:hypothetical protein
LNQLDIFCLQFPDSKTAGAIDRLAKRLVSYWDQPLEGSAELLANYARELFPEIDSDETPALPDTVSEA